MKKYKILGIFSLLLILAGCSSTEESSEIRVSWWGSNERNNATLEMIDLYNNSQDQYTVVPEYYDYGSYQQKFSTQMGAGQGACVAQIDQPWLINYTADDFVDLSDYSSELALDKYDESLLNSVTMEDSLVSLPASSNTFVFVFDKTVYDNAGVEIPRTWDELIKVNEQIQAELGEDYYAFGNMGANYMFMQYIYQMTGHLPLDDEGNWVYTEDDVKLGVDAITTYLDTTVPPIEVQPGNLESTDTNFVAGKIAGYYDWVSTYSNFAGQWPEGDEVEIVIYMTDPDEVTNGLFVKPSMAWSIPSSCENVDGAIDFLSFITTNEEAIKAQGMERGLPANSDAATLIKEEQNLSGPAFDAYEELETMEKAPFPVLDEELNTYIYDSFENYRHGDMTADEITEGIMTKAEETYN